MIDVDKAAGRCVIGHANVSGKTEYKSNGNTGGILGLTAF
jgi:hypothetical protein